MSKPIVLVWLTLRGVEEFSATAEQVARWQEDLPELEFLRVTTQEDFIRNLSQATFILTYHFCEAWLPLTYRAKWIATPAAGRELLGEKFPDRLLVTFGTFHGAIMAETAVGMLLATRRGLLPGIGLCTADMPWPEHLVGRRTIAGSRAVILGYGNIGKAVGEKLSALGVTCTGVTRKNLSELDTLLTTADALILALPATPETTNIIGEKQLALLPDHAVVINVGRGNAIHEQALAEALNSGHLDAAFLDVLPQEPYPQDGLLRHTPRCYLLPHASAFAPEYLDLAFAEWQQIYKTRFAAN
ncbi:MAG: hypothetical protein IJV69_03725 [Kiritimatiellae bacterium]|nr:hypothetical protein [Kiritimatiellia bacterium]